jgi:hypothetical protein
LWCWPTRPSCGKAISAVGKMLLSGPFVWRLGALDNQHRDTINDRISAAARITDDARGVRLRIVAQVAMAGWAGEVRNQGWIELNR